MLENEEFFEKIKNLDKSLSELNEIKKTLVDKQSYYDKMKSEFYHLFESGEFPPKVRKDLDKKFDECLKQRRKIKMQLAKLTSIQCGIKRYGIQTQISDKEKGENAYKPQILVDEFIKYDKYINYDILIEEEI